MRTAVALLMLALVAAGAGAEDYRFTLEEAVAYGLANSTSIRAKELAVAGAQLDLAAARAAHYPSLSAGASWRHSVDAPALGSPRDVAGVSADLSQTVASFGKIGAGVRLAGQAFSQATMDLAEEQRQTVLLIERAFYGYLLALEVQRINQETLLRRQDALEVARARFRAGLAADFDVLRAESDLESFRATVISSDNGVRTALLNVKNVLGIQEEEFRFELVGALEPIAVAIEREKLVAQALDGKYALRSLRLGREMLKGQEALSRSLNRPTLVGWARYELSTPDVYSFDPDFLATWRDSLSVGLNLSVPVSVFFPWSEEKAGLRKAALDLEGMGLSLQSAESGVRLAVESTILKIDEQQAKIASGQKAVELAQRLYDSAQRQYEGGYISSIDLKDAELGLNAARLAYAQAIFGYNQSVLDLMDAVGVASF